MQECVHVRMCMNMHMYMLLKISLKFSHAVLCMPLTPQWQVWEPLSRQLT